MTANASAVLSSRDHSGSRFVYSLDVSAYQLQCGTAEAAYIGNGEINFGSGLKLLQVSLSLITSVLPEPNASLPFLSTFAVDLAKCLERGGAISSLMRHLNAASLIAAATYRTKRTSFGTRTEGSTALQAHENAVAIVNSIFTIMERAASCSIGTSIPALLVKEHSVRFLVDNMLLKKACQHWYSLTMSVTATDHDSNGGCTSEYSKRHLRGYIQPSGDMVAANFLKGRQKTDRTSHPPQEACFGDPIHDVWRTTLRTLAALLRSFRLNAGAKMISGVASLDGTHRQCLESVIDFVSAYNGVILSSLYGCSSMSCGKASSGPFQNSTSSTQSVVTFTLGNLNELSDVLSLLMELCTGVHKNHFENVRSDLYQKTMQTCLNVARSLASFLGALGTARELFAALASLATEGDGTGGSASEEGAPSFNAFELHPLLAEGIPSARHKAIQNAHFVRSCCTCMTASDYALYLAELGSSGHTPHEKSASINVEKSFQIHVNNKFIGQVETIAAECLFRTLSVIAEAHPAASSFVYFSQEEAAQLDSMSLVHQGTIIALRSPPLISQPSGNHEKSIALHGHQHPHNTIQALQYARVLHCDYLQGSWDVELLDSLSSGKGSSYVKDVPVSSLAGMEDISNKRCIFRYTPAPKLPSDALITDLSVGHLVLTLRWCHQQAKARKNGSDSNSFNHIVECLAERTAMLLGSEISLHNELGSKGVAGAELSQKINSQLLELFDEVSVSNSFMGSPIANDTIELQRRSKRGLKSIIDDEVWSASLLQMEPDLTAARYDREEARKQWEQGAGSMFGASNWGSSQKRGGRRSPFRGSGGITLR